MWLPDETSRGVKKWRYLPNGDRDLAMSTENLNRAEKSIYIEKLMAWAATDLNVEIRLLDTHH